jgi:uncharacterized protein
MNPQERAVIDGIFERLRNVANQPRDAEVERYIADLIRQQPYAPYAMAQSVYVQEQALLNQQQEIERLRAENEHLRQPPQQQSGGFLSGLFGGSQQPQRAAEPPAYGQRGQQGIAPQPAQPMTPQSGPWGGAQPPQQPAGGPWAQQPPQAPQKQGMGFLGTAASAAAGVAGGMVLGSILSSAFGGGGAKADTGNHLGGQNFLGQSPNPASGAQGEPQISEEYDEDDSEYDSDDSGDFGSDDSYEL